VNAFNRSMYMLNPMLDLPEVENSATFLVDVYKSGDKFANITLRLNESEVILKPEDGQEITFKYSDVVQCK